MTEHELQNQIRIALSQYGLVFRTNSGAFWQGRRVYVPQLGGMVLTDLSRIEGLPEGFSDLLFVDAHGCAFIEVKAKGGRLSAAQKKFLDRVQAMGHRAGVARSVADAVQIVQGG